MNLLKLFSTDSSDKFLSLSDKVNELVKSLPLTSRKKKEKETEDLIEKTIQLGFKLNENTNEKDTSKKDDKSDNEVDYIFKGLTTPKNRITKYKVYDELYESLQLCKRIMKVYIDNLLQTDGINNKILFVKPDKYGESNYERYLDYQNRALKIIDFYDIDINLKRFILPNLLKYGDFFIEVIDIDNIEVPFDKSSGSSVITENIFLETFESSMNSYSEYKQPGDSEFERLANLFISFENNSPNDSIVLEQTNKTKKSPFANKLSRIVLKYHLPHQIIPLITPYNNILGYVELAENSGQNSSDLKNNPLKNLMSIVNKLSNSNLMSGNNNEEKQTNTIKKFTDLLVKRIIKEYKIKIDVKNKDKNISINKEYENKLREVLEPEMFLTLKKLIFTTNQNEILFKKINVRFIFPENMIHYSINSNFNFPFGTSIFDQLVYPGKLYLLTQMTNTMMKVSRSALIRNWKLEVGSRTDHMRQIEKFKRELRNARITASDFVSSKNISNILSDFKDLITITQDGKEKVSVNLLQQGDPNVKTQDLEDLRKELVGLSGIPASMLGFGDGEQLREQLVHSSVSFANEIIGIQQSVNESNRRLITLINSLITDDDEDLDDFVKIVMMPPTILLMQMVESSMNTTNMIQGTLQGFPNFDTDPMYILKRFVPWIEWDDYVASAREKKFGDAAKIAGKQVDNQLQSPDSQGADNSSDGQF